MTDVPTFKTEAEAFAWMNAEVDDPYIGNERLAYRDDALGQEAYARKQDNGCCGFFDREVVINGRVAEIGCNYGH